MKAYFYFAAITFALNAHGQNIGIGTNSPNPNAILDISSSNKALLLPRLPDTSAVTAPAAGMIIYDQQSNTPNFHDGAKWNRVNEPGNVVTMYGSMNYVLTGTSVGGIAYETGILNSIDLGYYSLLAMSSGGGGGTGTLVKPDSVNFTKEFDGNSIAFKRAHMGGNAIQAMEITELLPNGTKLFSIKLFTFFITSQRTFISTATGKLTEQYSLSAATIGFKDWVTNKSFSYNVSARTFGVY